MDSCELVVTISLIACGIAKCYPSEDLALLASVFSQLGDTLGTIAANNELHNEETEEKDANKDVDK